MALRIIFKQCYSDNFAGLWVEILGALSLFKAITC